jgi:hypothetical protein
MNADDRELRVECYAGHRGEETPRRLHWCGRTTEIVEILDRWLAPDHRYFKVRVEDGSLFILRHDLQADRWEWTLFQRGQRGEKMPDVKGGGLPS